MAGQRAAGNQALEQQIVAGLAELNIDTEPQRLLAFVLMLDKWNHSYNLTAVREPAQMVVQHLFDSLVMLPFIIGPRIIDVGTGAGLPGIPLALVSAGQHFVLLDSNRKKTRFVLQAVAELGLANVEVVTSRAEDYRPVEGFDTVICRAYATIGQILASAGHLCRPGGQVLAMKGQHPAAELAAIVPPFTIKNIQAISVPQLRAARHVVSIDRMAAHEPG
ncbi:MAG: 16S rRNA (guanine(527)-N(7))-methyltransferase RsmG [Gammaproteobacteria bacterium]|nr:16S rRNA (guanine(527)-N(7))-methyltransferase RsmG [Gammaproteobacteria bacterium]